MASAYILFFSFLSSFTSQPEWLDYSYREANYPKDEYYQGFISRNFTEEENRAEVENEMVAQSRIRLSESIRVFISSESTSTLANLNTEATESFEQQSITKTELDASGLETLTYFDDRKKIAYSFCYIKKRKLQSSYFKLLQDKMSAIKSRIAGYSEKRPPYNALIELLSDLDEVKKIQNTLTSTGISNAIVLMTSQYNQRRDWVNGLLEELKGSESVGLQQAAVFLRDGLVADINSRSLAKVKVNRMTYKNTGIATELSVIFDDYFQDVMSDKFTVVNGGNEWVVNTTYWPLGENLKVTTTIHQTAGNELLRLIASTSINVAATTIEELGVDYEPLKKEEDRKEFQVITQNQNDGEILVEITTHKGVGSSIFKEGETLKLLTKVSRPSYIQLINVWADGSKLLLLDNYYVDLSQTNKFVELPFEWETACPCGVEYIYAIASYRPLAVPETTDQDGFLFITESLTDAIARNRGFKLLNRSDVSEASLILTTMPAKP